MFTLLFALLLEVATHARGQINPLGWRYREGSQVIPFAPVEPGREYWRPITCLGDRPDQLPPVILAQGHLSLLEMCAHGRFGGRLGSNSGGFCNTAANPPSVAFQGLNEWPPLANAWIRMICHVKCRCSAAYPFQRRRGPVVVNNDPLRSQLSVVDFDQPGGTVGVGTRPRLVNLRLIEYPIDIELGALEDIQTIRKEHVVSNGANHIYCHVRFLQQLIVEYFFDYAAQAYAPDIEKRCMATIVGGRMDGNTGGVCLRNKDPKGPEVFFLDELAHPDFYWRRNGWAQILRLCCFAACHCEPHARTQAQMLQRVVPFLDGQKTILQWINIAKDEVPPIDDDSDDERTLTDDSSEGGFDQRRCAVDPRTCQRPGPKKEPSICKGSCSSVKDWCGSGGCVCAALAQTGIGFVASCMVYSKGRIGLSRRDDLVCPCNSTYVSKACCGSSDGLIWEDRGLRLGGLALESR